MEETAFRRILFDSPEYEESRGMRDAVLRIPLGLSLSDEDRAAERDHLHYGLYDAAGRLLACVIAVPEPGGTAKIRQMAVTPAEQGKGLGAALLRGIEQDLADRGYGHLHLNARIHAAAFYRRLGYHETGGEFIEVGIPHIRMEKHLAPP